MRAIVIYAPLAVVDRSARLHRARARVGGVQESGSGGVAAQLRGVRQRRWDVAKKTSMPLSWHARGHRRRNRRAYRRGSNRSVQSCARARLNLVAQPVGSVRNCRRPLSEHAHSWQRCLAHVPAVVEAPVEWLIYVVSRSSRPRVMSRANGRVIWASNDEVKLSGRLGRRSRCWIRCGCILCDGAGWARSLPPTR